MSDQDNNLFNGNPQENNSGDPAPSTNDLFADQLKEIKGEDGAQKYKSVEEALKALKESQAFIPQLLGEKKTVEQQLADMQAELEKRRSVEDVVKELTSGNQPAPTQTPKTTTESQPDLFDEAKAESVFEQLLEKRTKQETEVNNLRSVQNQLVQAYGDKARSVIQDKAKELGTTSENLEQMAKTNPQIVLSLFENTKVVSDSPTMSGTISPQNPNKQLELKPNEKKIMTRGASTQDLQDAWAAAKKYTYESLGVET